MKKEINRRAFICHMGAALLLPLGGSADPRGIIDALRPAHETRDLEEPELTTSVLVQRPNLYPPLPDGSFQIDVDGKGLDAFGDGFKVTLYFHFSDKDSRQCNKVLADLTAGSIWLVKGHYYICWSSKEIEIYQPEYWRVESENRRFYVRRRYPTRYGKIDH